MAVPPRRNGPAPGRHVRNTTSASRGGGSRAGATTSPELGSGDSHAIPQKIQAQLLETIGAAVESGQSPEEVAQVSLRVFLDLTDGRWATVYLRDEQTRQLRCLAVCGDPDARTTREWDQIVGRVVRANRVVAADDLVALPLRRGRLLEGVLIVQGLPKAIREGRGVMDLLAFVGSRLADGLDHSRLSQKYAQKIVRIQQLEEVGAILNSSLAEHEMVRRAIEVASRLVDAEGGSLLLLDERRGDLVFEVVVGDKREVLEGLRLKLERGIAGCVARTGEALIVNDAQNDPRVARDVDQRTGVTTRTILCVPVRAHGRTLGVLETVNKRGGRLFSNWDLVELTSLGNQVAIALENTRLFRDYHGKIKRLQKLQEISAVLNSSLNQAEIRKRAIEAATVLMDAEAGSLLLLDEAAGELYFDVALGEKGEGVRQIRLKVGEGIAGHVAQTGAPLIVHDVQNDPRFSRQADKKSGFVTRSMVCVPVKAREKMLGVLQAINKKDGGLFAEEDLQDFVSLGHQVGIAIDNANLYEEINRLFEGFISASVLAIESRDPTTSGHSGRVATLTCGLAEVVDRLDRGPYANISFSYDQMKEIRYAAVLHDFGKVGVREHVLVKAEKLYPGDLAMLKARFDFIKRTLETQALRRKVEILMSGDRAATAALLAEVDKDLANRIAETDGVLEFLLGCNQPTVLPKEGFDRLSEIAGLTYEHFDGSRPYLSREEIITLSIPKGSLTKEQRKEIESHVTHTYRFLKTIPWTKALKNVPEIAYGHHEKLDGTGYPRQVPGDNIAVQTRMMTISDIYDALTAADRPYKAAVSIPMALTILEQEVQQGKVDRDLLKVFIEAKVYERARAS